MAQARWFQSLDPETDSTYVRAVDNRKRVFKNVSNQPQQVRPPSRWRSFDSDVVIGVGQTIEVFEEIDAEYMLALCRPRMRTIPSQNNRQVEEPGVFAEVSQ